MATVNRSRGAAYPIKPRATFLGSWRSNQIQQRIAVVGNGNIDVGNKSPTRKPGLPIAERLAGSDGAPELRIEKPGQLTAKRPANCGAMLQQCGDSGRGNESVPQEFVRLVGCRDRNIRPERWVRPRAEPAKR
jgi:hypothetical protein